MAEVLVTYGDPVVAPDGTAYTARACGAEMEDGRWHGWIEFEPAGGGRALRSTRETTQPNRTDTAYWATGLTPVFLEGSLERTLRPGPVSVPPAPPERAAFDGPAPAGGDAVPPPAESVLNPFSVYRKGEALLRQQLTALAAWHLVNIIRAYGLSERPAEWLERQPASVLAELIVEAVRDEAARPA